MSQERVTGYVVGSKKHGKVMMVRVTDLDSEISGQKLAVASVAYGTKLRSGLDVSFIPDSKGGVARNVEVIPQAEETTPISEGNKDSDVTWIAVHQMKDGTNYLTFSPFSSREEYQREIMNAGGEEVVIDVMSFTSQIDESVMDAIHALSEMNGSFQEVVEELLTAAFELGQKHPKTKPA